jgi:hypothetical protein
MIFYIKDPKISTKKNLLDLKNTLSRVAVYKTNTQKPIMFSYTSNEQSEKEIRKTMHSE